MTCCFLLWTVPAAVSNLATVVASSPACQPSQILPRCAPVISCGDSRFDSSRCVVHVSTSLASWQSLRGATRQDFNHVTRLDRFLTCDCSLHLVLHLCGHRQLRPPHPTPGLLQIHSRQTSRVTSDQAAAQGWLCRPRRNLHCCVWRTT